MLSGASGVSSSRLCTLKDVKDRSWQDSLVPRVRWSVPFPTRPVGPPHLAVLLEVVLVIYLDFLDPLIAKMLLPKRMRVLFHLAASSAAWGECAGSGQGLINKALLFRRLLGRYSHDGWRQELGLHEHQGTMIARTSSRAATS
jgi:hypothetical protein